MFDNIIGNDKIKKILETSINQNKISHSYLFVGIEGIGKKTIAKEFAKNILCFDRNSCINSCKSCVEFLSENHPDFEIIEPDGNSIKIEQIRMLQKKIQEKTIVSSKKIYIINDAEKMTKESQNCLLKTLEEPPEYAIIILIGKNENLFLETIKSRCIILNFGKIENNSLEKFLKEKYNLENLSSDILQMFQGSIGKAIDLKDKIPEYEQIKNIIDNLDKTLLIEVIDRAKIIYESKEEIMSILEYINVILLEKSKIDYKYTKCIQIVENTKERLKNNSNYDMSIDNMLFNIWREIN